MRDFIVCDADGRIVRWGAVPDRDFHMIHAQSGESVKEGIANARESYVVSDSIVPRPVFGVSMGSTTVAEGGEISISGIPAGTTATVEGNLVVVDDGILTVTLPYAGKYRVRLEKFPYQDWEQEFVCT